MRRCPGIILLVAGGGCQTFGMALCRGRPAVQAFLLCVSGLGGKISAFGGKRPLLDCVVVVMMLDSGVLLVGLIGEPGASVHSRPARYHGRRLSRIWSTMNVARGSVGACLLAWMTMICVDA